jgi:hypothetical protein
MVLHSLKRVMTIKAKEVLESEYGQMADVVNTYVVNIMSLRTSY